MYSVEKNFYDLNCTALIEPEVNREASNYCVENYPILVNQARKMIGVDINKAEDLVHDVIVSILNAENVGNGFNPEYTGDGTLIDVSCYVYGRLKQYSKNSKYAVEGCDRKYTTDENGEGKICFDITYVAPVVDPEDQDNLNANQMAMMNASAYNDDIENIETNVDLRDDIKYCAQFSKEVGFDVMKLFRNTSAFDTCFDNSLFDKLRNFMAKNNDFRMAFRNVLEAAAHETPIFESVMATL